MIIRCYVCIGRADKTDRPHMIKTFKNITKYFHPNHTIPSTDLFSYYSDSFFAPVGQGHISYDCFRIYESISAGCIPIVVSNYSTLLSTFSCYKDKHTLHIPWLMYESWEEAKIAVLGMLGQENITEIRRLQRSVIEWWRQKKVDLVEDIRAALL